MINHLCFNRRVAFIVGLALASTVGGLLQPGEARADDCLLDSNNDGVATATTDTDGGANSAGDDQRLACGVGASATGTYSMAIGQFATASAGDSTAIGWGTDATGTNAVALGDLAQATAGAATALGGDSSASATGATAVGDHAGLFVVRR